MKTTVVQLGTPKLLPVASVRIFLNALVSKP